MTVLSVTTLTIKPDRYEEFLASTKKTKSLLEKHGAKNVRLIVGMSGQSSGSFVAHPRSGRLHRRRPHNGQVPRRSGRAGGNDGIGHRRESGRQLAAVDMGRGSTLSAPVVCLGGQGGSPWPRQAARNVPLRRETDVLEDLPAPGASGAVISQSIRASFIAGNGTRRGCIGGTTDRPCFGGISKERTYVSHETRVPAAPSSHPIEGPLRVAAWRSLGGP